MSCYDRSVDGPRGNTFPVQRTEPSLLYGVNTYLLRRLLRRVSEGIVLVLLPLLFFSRNPATTDRPWSESSTSQAPDPTRQEIIDHPFGSSQPWLGSTNFNFPDRQISWSGWYTRTGGQVVDWHSSL